MACECCELSILLTGDAEISKLNQVYRNKKGPTDVLSFAMHEGRGAPLPEGLLGDVAISVETAARQAEEDGSPLADELLRLLIHGVLHLCGFEHEGVSARKAAQMKKAERQYFVELKAI